MGIFSDKEIRRRWEEVQRRTGDVDCTVAPSFHNSYYLSGVPVIQYGRWAVTILLRGSEPVLIAPEFEASSIAAHSPISSLHLYVDDDGPTMSVVTQLIADTIRSHRARTIGIDADGMPTSMYFQLLSTFPTAKFVDVSAAIDSVRIVSSAEEIRYLREASRIADVGMTAVLERTRVGVEETELSAQANLAMQQESTHEFLVNSTSCYMQQSGRSFTGHARAVKTPVKSGGMLEVCCESHVWHYFAGVERAILIGDVPKETERAYEAMLRAFNASRAAIRPGVMFQEVHRLAREQFTQAGYDKFLTGSGVVRNVFDESSGRIEMGNLRLSNRDPLAPGMVLSIEPWAAVPGVGGPRHCDMVLVTKDGHEVLSKIDCNVLRVT